MTPIQTLHRAFIGTIKFLVSVVFGDVWGLCDSD